jgi:acetylglutamate kinase
MLNISTEFVGGMRVTDELTLKIVEEELNKLNDLIVNEITTHGVIAKGLKKEDKILEVVKKRSKIDLGFVGEVIGFDREKIKDSLSKAIPVIAPMGISKEGVTFNINADEVASFLASQLKAEKLVLLTNVGGVMRRSQDESSLISTMTVNDAQELIKEEVVEEGMIPKVRAAVGAIQSGVAKAHIIDAKIPHAILLEIFTDEGIGTEIVK